MILFVSAIFNDDGTLQQYKMADIPMLADVHEDGRRNTCVGVIHLKTGINPHEIQHHIEHNGAGGGRFKDSIADITNLCCRRTPATREAITEALATEGQDSLHMIARTWLAEKLPAEYDDYYGIKLESHPRAVKHVHAMIHKAAHGQPIPTNFKKHLRAEARVDARVGKSDEGKK